MGAPVRILLVYCTCPDEASALRISDHLVEKQFAACVNVVPGLRSIYRWKGEIQRDPEVLLLIKTREDRFDALREAILALHPYELPEVIAVPVCAGSQPYLDWVRENT
jgi:periplasmic divalent cation tolerance protein